jgi:hypothetical protein
VKAIKVLARQAKRESVTSGGTSALSLQTRAPLLSSLLRELSWSHRHILLKLAFPICDAVRHELNWTHHEQTFAAQGSRA